MVPIIFIPKISILRFNLDDSINNLPSIALLLIIPSFRSVAVNTLLYY